MQYQRLKNKSWNYAEDDDAKKLWRRIYRFVAQNVRYLVTLALLVIGLVVTWNQLSQTNEQIRSAGQSIQSLRLSIQELKERPYKVVETMKQAWVQNVPVPSAVGEDPSLAELRSNVESYCTTKLEALDKKVKLLKDMSLMEKEGLKAAGLTKRESEEEFAAVWTDKERLDEQLEIVKADKAKLEAQLKVAREEKEKLQARAIELEKEELQVTTKKKKSGLVFMSLECCNWPPAPATGPILYGHQQQPTVAHAEPRFSPA